MVSLSTISAGILSICLLVVGALFNANIRRWAQEKGHDVYILWLLSSIPKRWLWVCLALICALLVWPLLFEAPKDQNLPGFSASAYLRMYDTPELRRRYIFQFSNPDGGKTEFFLSSSDIFTFSLTDVRGETYALEIPYGPTGLPIDRYIFLYCDAGIDKQTTTLRVFVDGKEIKSRTFDLAVEIGSHNWQKITFGADNNGQLNAPFKVAMLSFGRQTLTKTQIRNENDRVVQYLRGVNSPVVP
jgi:hypothetical protein